MLLISIISLSLLILGIIEKQRHLHRLRKIPIRIHINGTRGKSLLNKMIVDLFGNDGRSVIAKVTGETPLILTPKSQWIPGESIRNGSFQCLMMLNLMFWDWAIM